MQTLGLSSKPQPADNLFKRLFWPSIESQYDVDLLGQQGFWVCTIVAVLSLLLMLFIKMPILGILTAAVFFLAGCGVRQRSVAAAVLIFSLYLVNIVSSIVLGSFGNPLIPLIILMLLFANVRATIISRRWMAQPIELSDQEFPERSTTTLADRFANTLPTALWPVSRYVLYPIAAILLSLTLAGLIMAKKRVPTNPSGPSTPSMTLEITPSSN